jgi:hypothetical protein
LFSCFVWDAKRKIGAPPLQLPPIPLLKTLEDMLYNRIIQKKQEMHKTQNRADTADRAVAKIEALQLILLQSHSIRRLSMCDIVAND